MKSYLIRPLLALGLGPFAIAGETTAPAPYTAAPSESPSLWSWYAGASAGYLIDSEENYYTLHLGMKLGESGPVSHSLFLEGAYTELSDLGLNTEIVPVTLNYKMDYYFTDSLSLYAGAGVGAAFVSNDFPGFKDDSVELAAQIFAGIGYDVTRNFQIYTGARWIWIDDSDIAGVAVDLGADVGLEFGARLKF